MNINWKIRVKNVSFWVSVAIAIITPILAYMGITAGYNDMASTRERTASGGIESIHTAYGSGFGI